jgi:hypothetical protein
MKRAVGGAAVDRKAVLPAIDAKRDIDVVSGGFAGRRRHGIRPGSFEQRQ